MFEGSSLPIEYLCYAYLFIRNKLRIFAPVFSEKFTKRALYEALFLFYMKQEKVEQLINEAVAENPKLFLVEWSITPDNKIEVLVDGDDGLPIEEVVRISRHVEHNLDREEEDFSLTVSSPGLSRPLTTPRQFIKNIGRTLKVKPVEGKELKGNLVNADDEKITLQWKAREPKPKGKGKHTVEKETTLKYDEITNAIIQIKFQ